MLNAKSSVSLLHLQKGMVVRQREWVHIDLLEGLV
jgi:hypothetical protein